MNVRSLMLMMLVIGHANAWNGMGHRVIAQIAVDQLPNRYINKL